jgi:hypothetical protein
MAFVIFCRAPMKIMSENAMCPWASSPWKTFWRHPRNLAMLLLGTLLAACGGSQLAFLTEGDSDHSLTIERRQSYARAPWETDLIVAGMPECQRRYPLEGLTGEALRIDVYRPEPGIYILAAGQRWFVAELKQCGFQQYRQPPPEPGERIGAFEVTQGALRYIAAPKKSDTN